MSENDIRWLVSGCVCHLEALIKTVSEFFSALCRRLLSDVGQNIQSFVWSERKEGEELSHIEAVVASCEERM